MHNKRLTDYALIFGLSILLFFIFHVIDMFPLLRNNILTGVLVMGAFGAAFLLANVMELNVEVMVFIVLLFYSALLVFYIKKKPFNISLLSIYTAAIVLINCGCWLVFVSS
jgi:hypothetical protein